MQLANMNAGKSINQVAIAVNGSINGIGDLAVADRCIRQASKYLTMRISNWHYNSKASLIKVSKFVNVLVLVSSVALGEE